MPTASLGERTRVPAGTGNVRAALDDRCYRVIRKWKVILISHIIEFIDIEGKQPERAR